MSSVSWWQPCSAVQQPGISSTRQRWRRLRLRLRLQLVTAMLAVAGRWRSSRLESAPAAVSQGTTRQRQQQWRQGVPIPPRPPSSNASGALCRSVGSTRCCRCLPAGRCRCWALRSVRWRQTCARRSGCRRICRQEWHPGVKRHQQPAPGCHSGGGGAAAWTCAGRSTTRRCDVARACVAAETG